ncbi:MAG: DUF2795 domain-containing protein [bacterium]|nr:DUF2795 domain-containing protein [bacterium]
MGSNTMATIVNPVHVQKFLKGAKYPCSKEDLMKTAEAEGAGKDVVETIRSIPMERFNSPNDVSEGIGKIKRDSDIGEGEAADIA